MYAIISDGEHQYRVEEGQTFQIQRHDLSEDATTFEFDHVLMVGDIEDGPKIGQPALEGAKVVATILGEIKGDKITVQKFRRRKHYSRKTGHRQRYLKLKVDKIEH
ncbi:MAG: 50S ribosomal protein L21 [Phycisphaerales bacterium]|nr:MAG: 50S ribosomal protein L21 [Phycisphaerales bacterium]